MAENKLVSVIIPIYNMENFLVKCLDSVRCQSYQNLEIILVDDGSTDKSALLCDCFAEIDSRIHVIHKENGGLGSARNAGLERASGEYIYFLDSDDYIEQVLIERAVEALERTESDWCGFWAVREDQKGRVLYRISSEEQEWEVSDPQERFALLLERFLNYRIGWEAWIHVFRRDNIEEAGLRFADERVVYAEDLLFSFGYLLRARKGVGLQDILYHYVERENSLIEKNKDRNVLPRIHRLAEEMYLQICNSQNSYIKERFHLLYLSLMEWHARPYIEKRGVKWVRSQMEEMRWKEFFPTEYFSSQFAKDIKEYGARCGVISILIFMGGREEEKVRRLLDNILQQSIQRLEVVIIWEKEVRLENEDCRVRNIVIENIDKADIFYSGFKAAHGEYVYFPDMGEEIPDAAFLQYVSDSMKYNLCDVGILCRDVEYTEVYETGTVMERKKVRTLLGRMELTADRVLFRKDLLWKSGLKDIEGIGKYMKNLILSGKVIFLKEDKKDEI